MVVHSCVPPAPGDAWVGTYAETVLHRVRLGPYTQVEAMNRVRSKLSENGVDVAVVRNQK
jgi:cell division protein FtsN